MSDRTLTILYVLMSGLFLWVVVNGLRTGEIWSRFGADVSRSKQPFLFWLYFVIWSALGAMMLYGTFQLFTSKT